MSTTPNSRRRIAIVCAFVAVVGLTVSALFGRFGFTSVCSRCGAIRDTTDWQIPLTSITVFSLSSTHASPVSTILTSTGIIVAHEHKWLFCQGGGNGVRCAIGAGRHIRPAVESDGVAAVIAASQRFGELQFRDRLLRALFFSLRIPLLSQMSYPSRFGRCPSFPLILPTYLSVVQNPWHPARVVSFARCRFGWGCC